MVFSILSPKTKTKTKNRVSGMKVVGLIIYFAFLISIICACGSNPSLNARNAGTFETKIQTGKAVYYSDSFHGRKTASGEIYDREKFTAAHRDLPFGTLVRVTNLTNRKSVVVKINDRGPFGRKERIIDLSYAAAKKIGMLAMGVANVKLEILNDK